VAHNVHQSLFRTRFIILTKFNMLNGSHMDLHIIYHLTVVHLFEWIFNLGPRAVNMLQAPHYLNPALVITQKRSTKQCRHATSKWKNLLHKIKVLFPISGILQRKWSVPDEDEAMNSSVFRNLFFWKLILILCFLRL